MNESLWKTPEEFPELSPDVTRSEVQEHLYLRGQFGCDRPCPQEQIKKIYRTERVKKSADDMTVEELARYLTHEWDGYVDADEYEPCRHARGVRQGARVRGVHECRRRERSPRQGGCGGCERLRLGGRSLRGGLPPLRV